MHNNAIILNGGNKKSEGIKIDRINERSDTKSKNSRKIELINLRDPDIASGCVIFPRFAALKLETYC